MISTRCALAFIAITMALPQFAAAAEPDGKALMLRFECNRCHDGTGAEDAPRDKHCVRCHKEILTGQFPVEKENLQRWQRNLISLPAVPSLVGAGARLRRDFIAGFLLRPHDLRPGLLAMMPRLAITPSEARAIAFALVPPEVQEAQSSLLPNGDLKLGRQLLETRGCGTCHRFSGVSDLPASPLPVAISPAALTEGIMLAPDLRHTRQRFQPDALVRWLLNPAALKADTRMPRIPLDQNQVRALAAYILQTPLAPISKRSVPKRLPLLSRAVGFDEVNERVFRRTCWHCHSTPAYAMGDGGPGNTGGFGFAPRGLNLASYRDIASGSLDDHGQRRSIFLPLKDGTPRLVAVLLARQKELAGDEVQGLRGMPLGLPALSPEQIQLVESWIAQGRPESPTLNTP